VALPFGVMVVMTTSQTCSFQTKVVAGKSGCS
jgi:hypothetical protein